MNNIKISRLHKNDLNRFYACNSLFVIAMEREINPTSHISLRVNYLRKARTFNQKRQPLIYEY